MRKTVKRKETGKASSSSAAGSKKSKKQKSQVEPETEQIPEPKWKANQWLCDLHEVWQEELYERKMEDLFRNPDNALCTERAIAENDFRPLGVWKCFERLGWEACLSFIDAEGKNAIPRKAIFEWMKTLKKDDGNNPPRTTTLKGQVDGKDVVMSFDTIRQVVNFDSLDENMYFYPPDEEIYKQTQEEDVGQNLKDMLFKPGGNTKLRQDLNILPKLCQIISIHNVIPRSSDKSKVRMYDLRVLCALVGGTEILSLRQLVMCNIWSSRNRKKKGEIPHCRLITALMRMHGVLNSDTQYTHKGHQVISLNSLNDKENWKLTLTERYIIFKDRKTKQSLKGVKHDAPPLDEIEEEMADIEEEEESEESEDDEINRSTGQYKKALEQVVAARRPREWATWDRMYQLMWDRDSRCHELHRRATRDLHERAEHHAVALQWALQEAINAQHRDAEERRKYEEWYHKRKFVENPAPVPWDELPVYQGGPAPYPAPKTHASSWLPLQFPNPPSQPIQPTEPNASGSNIPFNFEETRKDAEAMMLEYFGGRVPAQPYDRHYTASDYQPPGGSSTL